MTFNVYYDLSHHQQGATSVVTETTSLIVWTFILKQPRGSLLLLYPLSNHFPEDFKGSNIYSNSY